MKIHLLVGSCVMSVVLLASSAQAAFMVSEYTTQSEFLTAAGPGLSFEDFEGLGGTFVQTLDSSTSAGSVSAGDIPDGVIFSASSGTPVPNIAIVNIPGVGPTEALYVFADIPLVLDFDPGVTAIGSDLFAAFGATSIMVTVLDDLGVMHDIELNNSSAIATGYLGMVITDGEVVQIAYEAPGGTLGLDNLHFGQKVLSDSNTSNDSATSTPEPASLALGLMGVAGLAVASQRRRG